MNENMKMSQSLIAYLSSRVEAEWLSCKNMQVSSKTCKSSYKFLPKLASSYKLTIRSRPGFSHFFSFSSGNYTRRNEAQLGKRGCKKLMSPCTADEQCCSRYKCSDPLEGIGGARVCIQKRQEDYAKNNSRPKIVAFVNKDFNGNDKPLP